jgi:hypothetical protein
MEMYVGEEVEEIQPQSDAVEVSLKEFQLNKNFTFKN